MNNLDLSSRRLQKWDFSEYERARGARPSGRAELCDASGINFAIGFG
jgi:hypothetical protein